MYGDFDNLDDLYGDRPIVRAAAFESKNHVLSYLTSQNDLMAAQDDFQMVGILLKADMTSMDMALEIHPEKDRERRDKWAAVKV